MYNRIDESEFLILERSKMEKSKKLTAIEAQIEELKQKKISELKRIKTNEAKEKRKINSEKRRLEAHLKILIGGYVIAQKDTKILTAMLSENLRENDRKSLKKMIDILNTASFNR